MSGVLPWTTQFRTKLSTQRVTIEQIGLRNWSRLKLLPIFKKLAGSTSLGRLTLPNSFHPMYFRPNSSDRHVLYQIFVGREYSCFDDLADPGLILDCGANAGYSSAYFLSQFPRCSVIAVEPDPGNFAMLERNLSPFGSRSRAIRAAIWSHPARLKISESKYRDGLEWSNQVVECRPDEEASVQAVDIGTLLADSRSERISLLKMDIEGAEAVVFSDNYQSWIDRVDNIAIELHDDTIFGEASRAFETAIAGRGFDVDKSGELTICRRSGA